MALQHIVLFSFPADLSLDDDQAMRSQVERSCTPLAFDYHLDATTVLAPEPEFSSKELS